ncbi:hypothetical protein CCR95_00645 [Thiocystis minor]|uniref:hypothetical protein n=1 Tax=Thiocystis minor TaxID=61597 RepID=UPI0019131E94|nr:hypothetical protein [Thiocystis minor]MBK5962651.1 hypothetical protein [Thiocystis minor]
MNPQPHLLFVYNADSGLFNTLADIGHKLFSPTTYPCSLCAITHGVLAERAGWRDFIGSLGVTCAFLHRDQFHARFPAIQETLPAIFSLQDGSLRLCADATAIGACQGLDDLRALILRGCLDGAEPDDDRAPENIQPIG